MEKMLVLAAHIGDYVWRCGGAIAKYVQEGNAVKIVILSDGMRGEANEYWKKEGATLEDGIRSRREESSRAAACLGVTDIEYWGLPDYPMDITCEVIDRIAHLIREFRPDFILTHDTRDAFNPDHEKVSAAVRQATATASGGGFRDGNPVSPRQTPIFGFETHMTEISSFLPVVYVDITDAFDKKKAAMQVFASQPHMYATYIRKAELRAGEASNRGGRKNCKYAEAFSIFQPIASNGRFVW